MPVPFQWPTPGYCAGKCYRRSFDDDADQKREHYQSIINNGWQKICLRTIKKIAQADSQQGGAQSAQGENDFLLTQ